MYNKTYQTGVQNSRELERILQIPRRVTDLSLLDPIRGAVTLPGARLRLWDDQARALLEALDADGLFGQLSVGFGKTLVCALLPTVLQKRAIILTKSALVEQTKRMIYDYRKDFVIRPDLRVVSYSTLSSIKQARILTELNPELIIADECHSLSDKKAARTKRFLRYMGERPDTIFCAVSGTICKRSIKDFAHLLYLALQEHSPLPTDWATLEEWSEALDVSNNQRPAGKLRVFCEGDEHVREGWRRRFLDTKGVIASADAELGCSLEIHKHSPPDVTDIQDTIREVEKTWERPDGEVLVFAMDVAKTLRQVRLGGYYVWDWKKVGLDEPDEEWLFARRDYLHDVRKFLASNKAKDDFDSPHLLDLAHIRGDLGFASWPAWERVRLRPKPPSVWVWITKELVSWVAKFIEDLQEPCIVWTDIVTFAHELSKVTRLPYYGAGSDAEMNLSKEDGTRSVIASIQAHGTGRNLQAFSTAVVAGGSPSGKLWEQLLGRLHRNGQQADTVTYHSLFPYELDTAIGDATFIQQTTGSPQKLLTCSYVEETND